MPHYHPALVPSQPADARTPMGVHHKPWEHTALKALSWGGVSIAGLALLPVIFSGAKGIAGLAAENAITFCTSGAPSGWAGAVSGSIAPWLGTSVAAGGLATAALSGGLAIGGLWLANRIDKNTKPGEFRWGSVIRWTALATSILISLPAVLPAISMGLMFLGGFGEVPNMLYSAAMTVGSLGATGAMSGANVGLGAAALAGLHALTCALPLGITGLFLGQKEEKPKMLVVVPAQVAGRAMPQLPMVRAVTA